MPGKFQHILISGTITAELPKGEICNKLHAKHSNTAL